MVAKDLDNKDAGQIANVPVAQGALIYNFHGVIACLYGRHANLKYKYGNRHFWARGYYVDTVGRNKKAIKAYIANQLQEDQVADQISLKEFVDPFTGSKNTKA